MLQLALAIDYAIILCHRFSDEHETKDARESAIAALSKAIPEIGGSSLTTISGLAALAFMKFGIGMDMAIVLIKAILLSLYIRSGNRWTVVDHTIDGSYIVFALYPGGDAIALTQTERYIQDMVPFLAAAAAIVLLAIIIFAFRKNAAKKGKKTAPQTAENTQ